MAKRANRATRFQILKDLYGYVEAGYATVEQATEQVKFSGHIIFKSELDKFYEAYPSVNQDSFFKFLEAVGAYKIAGRKGTGTRATSLDSDEKMNQIGILPTAVDEYKTLIKTMQDARKRINELITADGYSCGMYITRHTKKETDTAS